MKGEGEETSYPCQCLPFLFFLFTFCLFAFVPGSYPCLYKE